MVDVTGRDVRIYENSFEELVAREDLPQFDIIVLHGVWSWVRDKSRHAIVELARRHLKPGGAFYVSYNVLPGWSPAIPLRHLLSEFGSRAAHGPILSRVDQAIAFAEQMIAAGARYFTANPSVVDKLKHIKGQNRTYVAHEYFNQIWEPMTFPEVSQRLTAAKLGFGASANLLDNRDPISLPHGAVDLVKGITDPVLEQLVRDLVLNQQFRRDIFVKGQRNLSRGELRANILEEWFVLTGDRESPPKKVQTPAGEAELRPQVYEPLCAAISKRSGAFRVEDLLNDLGRKTLTEWEIWDAMIMLSSCGYVSPAQSEEHSAECADSAQRLNREILRQAEFSSEIQFLASPVTNSAIMLTRIEQLLLSGHLKGAKDPAGFALSVLNLHGDKLMVDGNLIEEEGAILASLTDSWSLLKSTKLGLLKSLGVI